MLNDEIILQQASFNPKVKNYIFLVVLFFLIMSIIGIAIIPFWLLGFGQWLSNKFFKTLSCQLTNKNLKFSKGLIIHIEKTIPLENIQDLAFIGGPILRSFGLTFIRVETAGGGGGHHNNNIMSILGINDAENFKTAILNQREAIIQQKYSFKSSTPASQDIELLSEIKHELIAIKEILRLK